MSEEIVLRPFQEKALTQYRHAYPRHRAHLGIAPTAFGKSIVSGILAKRIIPNTKHRFLVIAHREALVTQNAKKIRRVAGELTVGVEMAGEQAPEMADVISASVQSLKGARLARCLAKWREDGRPIFMIVDEAHHSLAPTYKALIETVKPDRLLGLTATAFRTDDEDGTSLRGLYPGLAFNISRGEMIDDGWLAIPLHHCIRTAESLQQVKTTRGDFAERELSAATNVEPRNKLVVNAALEAIELLEEMGQPVLRGVCFAVDVAHTERLAEMFRAAGFESKAIIGTTPVEERREWDDKLSFNEKHTILVSCGVLTEGWDNELCNLGLFARPTKSPVLADQMLGRILRYHLEKKASLTIDFEDKDTERVSIASTFNLPSGWNGMGESLRADEVWFTEQTRRASYGLRSKLWLCKTKTEAVRLLADTKEHMPELVEGRRYMWLDMGPEIRMVFRFNSFIVTQTPHGDFELQHKHGPEEKVIGQYATVSQALDVGERLLIEKFPDDSNFMICGIEDYRDASEAQKKKMDGMGLQYGKDVTCHEARILIALACIDVTKNIERGRVGFGKHRGENIEDVPAHYLEYCLRKKEIVEWMTRERRPELKMFADELDRRDGKTQGMLFASLSRKALGGPQLDVFD